ncbi:MAG: hypothetical protein JWL58_2369 [Streptosporangiaceae bacterium]|jgi:hypothetical protein|nr:hypothetical protein [Streptosporangiaceae bacterium]
MLASFDIAYADARAETLCFTLDEPPADALVTLPLRVGGIQAELRLLGSSHQVVAGPVTETVATLPGCPGPLPYSLGREVGGWSYRFTADVYRRGTADFQSAASFLRKYLADRDDALVGTYPGAPDAISGIMLRPVKRGLDWRTWHTYPRTREIVVTRSRMLIR